MGLGFGITNLFVFVEVFTQYLLSIVLNHHVYGGRLHTATSHNFLCLTHDKHKHHADCVETPFTSRHAPKIVPSPPTRAKGTGGLMQC